MATIRLCKVYIFLLILNLTNGANNNSKSNTFSCKEFDCASKKSVEEENITGLEFYVNSTSDGKMFLNYDEKNKATFKNEYKYIKNEIDYIKQFDGMLSSETVINVEDNKIVDLVNNNSKYLNGKLEVNGNVTKQSSIIAEHAGNAASLENVVNDSSTEQISASFETTETTNQTDNKFYTILKKNPHDKNYKADICKCDLKMNECDINCCCDPDCSMNMKKIFTGCNDSKDSLILNYCFNSNSMFKINLQHTMIGNGLFCIVKNNYQHKSLYKVDSLIEDSKLFKKKISQRKLFSYSKLNFDEPKMINRSYHIGDYIWATVDGMLVPFGLPGHNVNLKCSSTKYIHYLSDYSTTCIYSVPRSRSKCEQSLVFEMDYYLKSLKIIKSPVLLNESDFSIPGEICRNESSCVRVISYICQGALDIQNCIQLPPRRVSWDRGFCKDIVQSVSIHIYHNGTEGIHEVRAYFSLTDIESKELAQFKQNINLRFLWVGSQVPIFIRSGNPGYVIGKPIMSGRKIFSNNDTTIKKEAIELSYDTKSWLTVSGSEKGFCRFVNRKPITFGENLYYSCIVELDRYDLLKKKCSDLQEDIFYYLFGNDFTDMKLNSRFNKYVATYGNSRPEDTGDWVQVIIDMLPIISSQISFISHYGSILCKNIYSDLNIDVAYSKIGSFDKPQNKIIGVYFYFGSPVKLIYSINSSCALFQSSQTTLRISTSVRFIDFTTEPESEFAQTPGFEAKLPHDFFYPFFSESSVSVHPHLVLILFTLVYQSFLSGDFRSVDLV